MSETKHTPGPLLTKPHGKGRGGWFEVDVFDDDSGETFATAFGRTEDEALAKAALITTAPETARERDRLREVNAGLLAALREVLATGLNGGNNVRLAYIAASRQALSDASLASADASEAAVARARAAIAEAEKG